MAAAKGLTEDNVAEALANAKGIYKTAARLLGVTRQTVSHWVEKSERLQRVCDEAHDELGDIAESAMVQQIASGDGAMVRWYLATKHRERGYADKRQVDVRVTYEDRLDRLREAGLLARRISQEEAGDDAPQVIDLDARRA